MALAIQPDGKIVIGGSFTSINGITRNRIARLHGDGSLDLNFNPNSNGEVYCLAVRADGKILVGGNFNSFGGAVSKTLVRLNTDGTRDAGFNSFPNSYPSSIAIQKDGRVLCSGEFTNVSGVTRNYCARLLTDGALDASFNADANAHIYHVEEQPDGKVLVAGNFSTINGISRRGIARLDSSGSVDIAFNANSNGFVDNVALESDGQILIAGGFSTVGGVARSRMAKLNADGSLVTSFNPGANASVSSAAVQADGKIVIAGQFTLVEGQLRNRIARFNSDGTLDAGFNPGANSIANCTALQPDGKVLVGGVFTALGGATHNYIARLDNSNATQGLVASSANRVEWLRGGTSPEAHNVGFDLSTDGGNTWTALGAGTRISGGWELLDLSLPVSGHIRSRANTGGGRRNGSVGFLQTLSPFPPAPEIVIEQPLSVDIEDGGSRSLGVANVGANSSLTFTIKNTGNADLTGLGIAIDGPDAGMFTLTANPAATVSGPMGSTTFTVQFAPTSVGTKTAVLHVTSNDSDEGVFDITVTGSDPIPEIAVQQPLGTNIPDGGTKSMTVALGSTTSLVFTIQSVGTDNITGLTISKDGSHASEFTFTSAPIAPVPPNGSTTFTVVFNPTAGGTRTAALHIMNNDADESPFDITLAGQALTFALDTDNDGMGDAAEFQLASLGFNWQSQQTTLVNTYFANANGNSLYTTSQIQALNVGIPLLERNPATGVFTLTIGVEKSSNLSTFNPFPMSAPQTLINGQGKLEFQFSVPDNAAFFQLKTP